MRELKLRVRVPDEGMYEALGFHADGQMAEYRNAAGEYVEHGTTLLDTTKRQVEGRCILLQYTGPRDRNDVRIYEGDILEYVPSPEFDDGTGGGDTYVTEWKDSGFTARWLQAGDPRSACCRTPAWRSPAPGRSPRRDTVGGEVADQRVHL